MDAALQQRLDFPRLLETLKRQEAVDRALEIYLESTKKSLMLLEMAERDRNSERWNSTVQAMHSGAQNITAKRMVTLCMEAAEIQILPDERAKAITYHMYKEFGLMRELVEKQKNQKSSLL